jgi:hypothetical protein
METSYDDAIMLSSEETDYSCTCYDSISMSSVKDPTDENLVLRGMKNTEI